MSGNSGERSAPSIAKPVIVPLCRWEMKFCMPRNAIGVDPDNTALVVPPKPTIDPRTLRPTSTQAVVISRPTVPVRRVTPPTSSRSAYPAAPGPRALGEVRELKVVPGSLGREREFIDVSRDKNKRGGRTTGRPVSEEAAKNLSGKELLQAA